MYKEIQLQLHLFILWKVPALGTMWCWTHKWGQWNWPTRGNIKYILIPSYVQNSEDSHAEEEEKLDVITSTQIAFIFEQCIFLKAEYTNVEPAASFCAKYWLTVHVYTYTDTNIYKIQVHIQMKIQV